MGTADPKCIMGGPARCCLPGPGGRHETQTAAQGETHTTGCNRAREPSQHLEQNESLWCIKERLAPVNLI